MATAKAPKGRSGQLNITVPAEIINKIDDMVERAHQQGLEHVSRSSMARSLLQVTLGTPEKVAVAYEVTTQAYMYQVQLSKRLRVALLRELDEALNMDPDAFTE